MSEVQRFEGQLIMWNGERGFGALMPKEGGQELFVHVSAFPRDGALPTTQEHYSFEIVSDSDGRKRAARVQPSERRAAEETMSRVLGRTSTGVTLRRRREERRRRLALTVLGLTLAVVALGWAQFSVPAATKLASTQTSSVR